MTFLSIIEQRARLNECSAVTWCTACISAVRKHAFYVGEMLWRCMVIFNQVQFDSLFKCNQCWLEIPKGGFWKGKRRKRRKHSLGAHNEPRVEIKTWLLLSFHTEMSQTRQGQTEGRREEGKAARRWGGCRALCVNWHNDFVTQDLENKTFWVIS